MYYAVGIFSDTNLLTPAADWCALKLDSKIGTESLPEEEKIILKSFLKKSLFNITVQEVMTHQCRIFPWSQELWICFVLLPLRVGWSKWGLELLLHRSLCSSAHLKNRNNIKLCSHLFPPAYLCLYTLLVTVKIISYHSSQNRILSPGVIDLCNNSTVPSYSRSA